MPIALAQPSWLDNLSDEDAAFLKRFLLASGSLKDVAANYSVSYPTIRARLDKLVAKVRLLEQQKSADAFERSLLAAYADGRLDAATMKILLAAHQLEIRSREKQHDAAKPDRRDGGPAPSPDRGRASG